MQLVMRHMRTFKNVFNILIMQIPGLGRTLHLTKDMNDQMVEFGFQVKGELDILPKNVTQIDMCVKAAISTQNSKLLISLSLYYEM